MEYFCVILNLLINYAKLMTLFQYNKLIHLKVKF